MASITGGTVSYSRTVKISDYEPKKAEVTLSFGVDEGEDVEKILGYVSNLALAQTHKILGLKVSVETVAAAVSQTKATAANGKAAAAIVTAEEVRQAEKPQISTGGERVDPAQVVDEIIEDTPPVTDAMLTDAAKTTNKKINDPVRIKALRDKYAGKSPSILSEIPKEKRKEFLHELAKLCP